MVEITNYHLDLEGLLVRGHSVKCFFEAIEILSGFYWQWLPPPATNYASKKAFPERPLTSNLHVTGH